ncbi:MAG: hypothetical protein NT007_00060 [Candidatus Kapabacteria bacterium]|nr:hypothetical protein [Candidatus Kapabacteria bacterium]
MIIIFLLTCLFILLFLYLFVDKSKAVDILWNWFESDKIEFLIGLIIGIAGIYFGVQAMLEASNAVKKSEQIIINMSSFFNDFQSMMPRVCSLITEAKEDVQIMVSLPAYGYLINSKLGDEFFIKLNNQISKSSCGGPDIKFICFCQQKFSDFEDPSKLFQKEPFISFSDDNKNLMLSTYFEHKRTILQGLFGICKGKKIHDHGYCNLYTLREDPYLRIFIADGKKAILAITPNFNSEDIAEFNITGLYTEDKKMVEIIKNLFIKYSIHPITETEFALFQFNNNE